ncbi:HD-GYP domain-containing protein [Paenibacillus sp. FSL W7-1287]|uniref:HD-GYP domain-containing protein n=1 Tax=Paenibacillus sp. FSL W7-1287 TaxID=2954538 RepID=UPI0030FA0FCF
MRSRRLVLLQLGLAMIIPIIIYYWLQQLPFNHDTIKHSSFIYMIGMVALLAIIISVVIGVVAHQIRNIKVLFVSLAYASIGGMLILHGLSIPRLGAVSEQHFYLYAQLALVLSSCWLWLSSLSADHMLVRYLIKHRKKLMPISCAAMVVVGLVIWIAESNEGNVILFHDHTIRLTTLIILLLNTWTVYRHLITYMASRFSIQLAIVYSTGWLNTAQVVLATTSPNGIGWWVHHILLFLSMMVLMIVIVNEYSNNESLKDLVKQLYRADPDRWIQTYMTQSVSELVKKTEAKDAYTAGHNYRVTVYALKLGEEMGLSSSQLKSIAQGGLVHDVGKIFIPDYVLNKPGKLTDDERRLIEKHPLDGYNMCRQIGFMIEELAIIRSHHEKWNGTGYPDKLSGESIPLVARVTAIADVFDALTSSRSYRRAMSLEKAMSIINEESGEHFDPRCVEAWKKLIDEEKDFFEQMLSSHSKPSGATS